MKNKNVITSFSYPIEKVDVIELAEDRAKSEGKSLSQYIVSLMENEQKNPIGLDSNPIAVKFLESKFTNSLDYYLDNGFVTKQYWKKELEGSPNEKLEKLEAFGLTITETCRQVKHFKNTGRYLV
jgi:hypothetical protein